MMQVFTKTNFDFLRYKKIALICSLVFIGIGLLSVVFHGGLNFSIDFAGGTLVQLKFEKPIKEEISTIRTVVGNLGFGSPEIKTIGISENNEIQITVTKQDEGTIVADDIRAALIKAFPDNSFERRRVEKVGPKIGGELKQNMLIAGILALIAILIYVGFRFHLPFGVAAVVPLFHDVLVTITVFSIINHEVSITFIAALLTIIGYSLNDTIVIFDRIRENMHGGLRGKDFTKIVNGSINQTLSRTVITSLTTLFVIACLYILGSEAIKDFALALLIGITIGTYSTVFVASPVLLWWHSKRPITR